MQNLSFKMSRRTLKNFDYFESDSFMKTLKFGLFSTTTPKFNETTSFWTHLEDKLDGF